MPEVESSWFSEDPNFTVLEPMDFQTTGGKWGTSTFGSGGGTVTYSIAGSGWTNQTGQSFFTGSTVALANFLPSDYEARIDAAFAAWSMVANINFVKVADGGGNFGSGTSANIRIGGGLIDGFNQGGSIVGRAFGPPGGGTSNANATNGDIILDSGDHWNGDLLSAVILHEIGHSLGLAHVPQNNPVAVMNPTVNLGLPLQTDDISGIQFIYGPRPIAGSVSISDASITEGDSGTKTMTFTLTRTGGTAAFNVSFATADNSARGSDNDFSPLSGTVVFGASENTKSVSIVINGDTRFEQNETFFVNLSNPTNGGSISDGQGIGTIFNDDPNHPPTISASSISVNRSQVISASNLFSAGDFDGQELSYWFRDNTPGGGRFEYDGIAQAEGQTFGVSQSQLSHLVFRASNGMTDHDSITVNAYDGVAASNIVTFDVNVPPNFAPVVSASSVTATRNTTIAASSLFGATDANGDELSYWFRDDTPGNGHFEYDGIAQAEGQLFGVSQSQLSHLTFRFGGSGADNIKIHAWDGLAVSNVAAISANVAPNIAPTVSASSTTVTRNTVLTAASLFSADDANPGDELSYWFRDNTIGGGRFFYDGIAQAEGQTFGVSQSQLSHLTFRAGGSGSDSISVNAFDGLAASNVVTFNVDVAPNVAPLVATSSMTVIHNQVLSAASLFSASDANPGDELSYWFRDNTIGGGRFEFNGVAQAEGQTFGVSQAQLSQLTFRAGANGSDSISFNAWDGLASSGVFNFNIDVAPNSAPVVNTSSMTVSHGQVLSATSLFGASDADGDALSYWFRDNTPGGGRFEFDGVAQAEGQTFGVSQSQLSHLVFRAGANGSDNISFNAWDGQASSGVVDFNVHVAPNSAPTMSASNVALVPGQLVPASNLFSAGDADGDALSYWFRDSTIGGGHFEYDGAAQAEGQTFGVSAAQLSHLTFRAGGSGSTDTIFVNAWDGLASSSVVQFQIFV